MRTARRLSSLLLLAATATCGDGGGPGPEPPMPGNLTVVVASTGVEGAAFKLLVTGPEITQPSAVDGGSFFHFTGMPAGIRVVVVGPATSGPLLRFRVPDVGRMDEYLVVLEEVAAVDGSIHPFGDFTVALTR